VLDKDRDRQFGKNFLIHNSPIAQIEYVGYILMAKLARTVIAVNDAPAKH
jgi:hypothetical protein